MAGGSILVVEDDDVQRKQMARALSASSYDVIQAAGGHEAVRFLAENEVYLVLTDRKMPGMDGLSLLEHIRTHHSKIPVAVVTAYPEGMDDFKPDALLEKPFRMDALIEMVRTLLNSQCA